MYFDKDLQHLFSYGLILSSLDLSSEFAVDAGLILFWKMN